MRKLPWISMFIIGGMVFAAIFAPYLTPYSPIDQTLPDKLLPPFWEAKGSTKYILGTDIFGRDVLTRLPSMTNQDDLRPLLPGGTKAEERIEAKERSVSARDYRSLAATIPVKQRSPGARLSAYVQQSPSHILARDLAGLAARVIFRSSPTNLGLDHTAAVLPLGRV